MFIINTFSNIPFDIQKVEDEPGIVYKDNIDYVPPEYDYNETELNDIYLLRYSLLRQLYFLKGVQRLGILTLPDPIVQHKYKYATVVEETPISALSMCRLLWNEWSLRKGPWPWILISKDYDPNIFNINMGGRGELLTRRKDGLRAISLFDFKAELNPALANLSHYNKKETLVIVQGQIEHAFNIATPYLDCDIIFGDVYSRIDEDRSFQANYTNLFLHLSDIANNTPYEATRTQVVGRKLIKDIIYYRKAK